MTSFPTRRRRSKQGGDHPSPTSPSLLSPCDLPPLDISTHRDSSSFSRNVRDRESRSVSPNTVRNVPDPEAQRAGRVPRPTSVRLSPTQNCSNLLQMAASGKRRDFPGTTTEVFTNSDIITAGRVDNTTLQSPRETRDPIKFRNIFSPVPTQTVFDDVDDEIFGLKQVPDIKSKGSEAGKSRTSRSHGTSPTCFPEIKVEICDDRSGSRQNNSMIEETGLGSSFSDGGGSSVESLNVPSPIVRRRTVNGRLIVGLNDWLTAGELAKKWSRSEGNIPFCVGSSTDSGNSGGKSSGSGNIQNDDNAYWYNPSMSKKEDLNKNSNVSGPSRVGQVPVGTTWRDSTTRRHTKAHSLSANFDPGIISHPLHRPPSQVSAEDVRRKIKFLSPQPKRKLGPNRDDL